MNPRKQGEFMAYSSWLTAKTLLVGRHKFKDVAFRVAHCQTFFILNVGQTRRLDQLRYRIYIGVEAGVNVIAAQHVG